jgi:hypothetical protein
MGLTLSAALQARLRRQWTGCLCLPCLAALAAEDQAATASAGATTASACGAGVRIR